MRCTGVQNAVTYTLPQMNMEYIFLVMWILISTTLSCLREQEVGSICRVLPEDNTEWTLTCDFQLNIQEKQTDYKVLHIKHNDFPELIEDGIWSLGKNRPAVYSAPGYQHEKVYNNTVVIKIKTSHIKDGAIFLCLTHNGLLERSKACHIPKSEVLLECYSRNNRPYCDKEDGVRYTGNFIQNVTVEIPSKTLEESRLYLCSAGYSKADSVTCTFGGSRSADTENPTDDTALCSSNWCKNKDILDANEPSTDGSKLIFALAIPAYVIASLIVLYVCIRRLHPTGIILLKVFCHKKFREKSSLVGSRTTLPTRVDYVSIHSVEIK